MSYVLFYKKEDKKILICRSYFGLKIKSSSPNSSIYTEKDEIKSVEVRTYFKQLNGKPINIKSIKNEVKTNIELFKKMGIPNPRPKKLNNSLIYIGDNRASYMNNFIGGQIEDLEDSKTALIRELQEELLLNCNIEDTKSFVKDIESKLYNKIIDNSKTVYLVNIDNLKNKTKELLSSLIKEDAGEHIRLLSKLETVNGIPDVEIGEIHSLKWTSLEKIKNGRITKKFFNGGNDDSILEKKIKEIFDKTDSFKNKYYKKYIKYKSKYLESKNEMN